MAAAANHPLSEKRGENLWPIRLLECNQWLVWIERHPRRFSRYSPNGFALVVCLSLMVLIAILAVGMAGLASIELRRSGQSDRNTLAKTNARLALMLAIGQLQKNLGPDQRVSATAEILAGTPAQAHWTGAWRSTQEDGSSFFKRDDLEGGLSDARTELEGTPADRVMEWLVSGEGNPMSGSVANPVRLASHQNQSAVEVSKIPSRNAAGTVTGHHAWWTGDLGVRANVGIHDPRSDLQVARDDPGGEAWFRMMTSQAVDTSLMTGGVTFEKEELDRFASSHTTALTKAGGEWARQHAFDFTIDSRGVLADSLRGGLRRDLTAYFNGPGEVPEWKGLPGLSKSSSLLADVPAGGGNSSRYQKAGPRFGVLHDWARSGTPFVNGKAGATLPDIDPAAGKSSVAFALANENPVKLAGNQRSALQPVLVEATNFTHISVFQLNGLAPAQYQLRHHHYPRVVLWNPYNVELEFDRSIIMMQGNGRQEMWTDSLGVDRFGITRLYRSQWLSFEGGRSTSFHVAGSSLMDSEGYNDPYMGSYYFSIPKTSFKPGECLVFSPARSAEYDCLSPYRMGAYNLNSNELSCTVSPDPSRSYYVSGTDIGGGIPFRPFQFWYAPTPAWSQGGRYGVENQADDTRSVLKHVGNLSTITFEDFDRLPQVAVISSSIQYGGGREPRIAWNKLDPLPMQLLDQRNPRPTFIPDVRTREGIRLRWFDEHRSNLINSGALNNTPHFEEALLANWNPRASFAVRSPWENIGGSMPKSGYAGGPWFFGAYTRDLYDQAVGWQDQAPVISGGRAHGNPFGPPQEGMDRHILFDVPRVETGVVSMGQFQHARISELVWHPSYAIGNSLPDPRLGTGGNKGLHRSAAVSGNLSASSKGGFHESHIGWSSDPQRSGDKGAWAVTARALLGNVPEDDNLVYDLSFEANHTLWDRYFLSSGSAEQKKAFIEDPFLKPLPNARMRLATGAKSATTAERLESYHQSASALMVEGAFNVNSTRVEAWKALLGSSRPSGYAGDDQVAFPRVLAAPGGAWKNGDDADSDEAWAGHRELTKAEIDALAREIVREVKKRGPFISLADFINRRLAENQTGRLGTLQAAIENAGLNSTLSSSYQLNNGSELPNYSHPDNVGDATRFEQTLKPASKAWGAPAWLTQADILQSLGPVLSARSDSFVIRTYGDAVDPSGAITARAWCEAVVQRTPDPLDPDESGLNPRQAGSAGDFGRRFVITSFRWLSEEEI
jgi:hypothetical protein